MYLKKLKNNFFNTLDIVIIVVVVSILIAAFFGINSKRIYMLFDRTYDSVVTVSVSDSTINSDDFKVGEKIYFYDSDESVGTIVSVKNIKEKMYSAINGTLMYDYTDKNVGVLIEIETGIKVNQSKKYINSSVFTTHGTKFILYTDNVAPFECVVDNVVIDE